MSHSFDTITTPGWAEEFIGTKDKPTAYSESIFGIIKEVFTDASKLLFYFSFLDPLYPLYSAPYERQYLHNTVFPETAHQLFLMFR